MPPSVRKSMQQPQNQDPAQPENPDAALLIGGPGQEDPPEPEKPAAPVGREITINGRKFVADPELAQALDERNKDFDRTLNEKLSQRDRELAELRAKLQPKPDPAQADPYETLLFEKPAEAVRRIKEEIRQEVTGLYNADQSKQKFWNDFYKSNQDLDPAEDDFMVQAVLQQNIARLAPMRPDEAATELADLTRRQILRLSQKARENGEDEPKLKPRTTVEPASSPRAKPTPREEPGPSSLSDVIRARRKARLAGKSAAV